MRVRAVLRRARAMEQPLDENKFVVEIAVEDGFDIDRDIARARRPRAVAQQPQFTAVGHDSPQHVTVVQIFLQQSMRAAPRIAAFAELLVKGDDVNGSCVLRLAGPVRYRIALPADLGCRALEPQGLAEPFEKRDAPGLAREAHWTCLGNLPAPLETVPKQPNVGEGGLDLGAEAPGVEAEILWLLAR